MAEILEAIGPGGYVLEKSRKSEIAAAQLQFLGDLLHPGNSKNNESDEARKKSREVFQREFPEYFAKLAATREKIIARGRIRNDDEYYLIRDYIDDIEAESESSELLERLYQLADDFGAS